MRIDEIQARLAEIDTLIDTATGDDLTALESESRSLLDELAGLQQTAQARQQLRQQIVAGAGTPVQTGAPAPAAQSVEERAAAAFVQTRRMTLGAEQTRSHLISSGTLAQPTVTAGINDIPGAKYSSIIDLVRVVNCVGMGTHRVAYVDADAAAAEDQTEGQAAAAVALGNFNFVDIKPTDVAVLDYISKQAKKQTNLQYASKVREQAVIALRRKAAAIVTAALAASALNTVVSGSAIDAKTLRTMALSYGGDESTIGGAHLILNKADLIKFGDVRGTNEKKALYEITPDSNGNTGIIKEGGLSVRYVINSNVAEGTLFYGNLQALELDLFSDYEVKVSEDFAFDKLMDTIRGDVELGAAVIAKGAFIKYTTTA
ncbi:MAG: phage major capsid protein [Faecousia sp.]